MEVVRNITNVLVQEKRGSVVKPRALPATAKRTNRIPGNPTALTDRKNSTITQTKLRKSKSENAAVGPTTRTVQKRASTTKRSLDDTKRKKSLTGTSAKTKETTQNKATNVAKVRKTSSSGQGNSSHKPVQTKRVVTDSGPAQNLQTKKTTSLPATIAITKVKPKAPEKVGEAVNISAAPNLHHEKIVTLKEIVAQAELDRKIFCIFENHLYIAKPVREELISRGWLEYRPDRKTIPHRPRPPPAATHQTPAKVDHTTQAVHQNTQFYVTPPQPLVAPILTNLDILLYGRKHGVRLQPKVFSKTSPQAQAISDCIQETNAHVSLVWLSSKPEIQLPYFSYTPRIVNKFQKTTFCSKYGLWQNLLKKEELPESIRFPVQTPRMYNLGDTHSNADFEFDFYVTAASSLLRWLVIRFAKKSENVTSPDGTVPLRVILFALQKCELLVGYLGPRTVVTREDILRPNKSWEVFLNWYEKIINEAAHLKPMSWGQKHLVFSRAVEVLYRLRQLRPGTAADGISNLWIVKPYSAACGRGIFITNNFSYMHQLEKKRYIIQKYIERPHLIAGTKFDIRQWFMITSLRPLEFWIYKESYLRFCAVPFNMKNLHESVHLSNNAIQKKYVNDVCLPHQNMWDTATFKHYLKGIGHSELWEERIFPGMCDGITSALLLSQGTFDAPDSTKPGWFEVYGADFMLTDTLRDGPWLIEINEGPALDPSTPTTQRLCNQMLRDVIKVVIDHKANPKAETGGWQLGYHQKSTPT